MEPWTEVASWQWQAAFDFEERRIPFLREIENAGLLEAWHLQADAVGVIVDEHGCEIYVTQDRLIASTSEPHLPQAAMEALSIVEQVFEPKTLSISIGHQYVVPIGREYDEARIECGRRLWPETFEAVGGTDFALLFDGVGRESGIAYQVEFGVVPASDLGERLRRTVGRSAFRGAQVPTPARLHSLPRVSLFVDVHWDISSDDMQAGSLTRPSSDMMNARLSEEQDLVARVLTSLGVDEVVQREDDES